MARRIVGLLMTDLGVCDLARHMPPATGSPKQAGEAREHQAEHKGKVRKLTLEVRAFIRRSAGVPVPEVLQQIQANFGLTVSKAAVYTEWRSTHIPLGHPTPAYPSSGSGTSRIVAKTCV